MGAIIDKIDDVFRNIDKEERENIRKREAMDTIFSGEGESKFPFQLLPKIPNLEPICHFVFAGGVECGPGEIDKVMNKGQDD